MATATATVTNKFTRHAASAKTTTAPHSGGWTGEAVPGWVTDLPAAAAVAVLARRTGHLLIAVAGGVVLVALLRALLG